MVSGTDPRPARESKHEQLERMFDRVVELSLAREQTDSRIAAALERIALMLERPKHWQSE